MWVASSAGVTRVDPVTLSVVASVDTVGGIEGIAADAAGIWVSHHQHGSLSLIDPASNVVVETLPIAAPGPAGPMDPYVVGDDIWIPFGTGHAVVRVDSDHNVSTIPLPANSIGPVLALADAVWMPSVDGMLRIDPATNEVTVHPPTPGGDELQVGAPLPTTFGQYGGIGAVVIDGALWFTTTFEDVIVDRGDLHTDDVLAIAPIRGGRPRNMIKFENALWVMSEEGGSLERIPLEQITRQ